MKKQFHIVSLLIFSIAFHACTYQRLSNEAAEFEQKGMYSDASNLYLQALQLNNQYLNAKLGLQRSGQKVIDEYLKQFNEAYDISNFDQAVYFYRKAESLKEKASTFNVSLEIPPFYDEYYSEAKAGYLEKKYALGIKLIKKSAFTDAEKVFREILEIDPYYKEANAYFIEAIYEPKYQSAKRLMSQYKYRAAHTAFQEIISGTDGYKDCDDLMAESLESARVDISIADVSNLSNESILSEQFMHLMSAKLNELDNPFLNLVEYYEGSIPDAILKTKIISYSYKPGTLLKEDIPGYLRNNVARNSTINPSNYKKVKYSEYTMEREVIIIANFELVNTRNNQVLASHQNSMAISDYLNYAEYNGDHKRLVPGYWKYLLIRNRDDVIYDNSKDVGVLKSKLNNKRNPMTKEELTQQALEKIAKTFAEKIKAYQPE